MKKRYSIFWSSFSSNIPIAKRFGIEDDEVYLPYFIVGDELTKMENNQEFIMGDLELAKGILMGWNTTGSSIILDADRFKPTFINIMQKLKSKFNFEDMDIFICMLSEKICNENGYYAAGAALTGGLGILPDSSKIRNDLIINTWMILETEDSADRPRLFKDILKYYKGIKFEDSDPFRTEVLDYTYLVSLSQLGQHKLKERFYEDVAVNRITYDLLKGKTEKAMKIRDISFEELRVPEIFFH